MGWDPNPAKYPEESELRKRLQDFYEYCLQKDLPITTHCSPTAYETPELRDANHPKEWGKGVLTQYPKLRINFGHFGTGSHGAEDEFAWSVVIADLMAKHDNVYADLNVHPEHKDDLTTFIWDCLHHPTRKAVRDRIMYGSDWFMLTVKENYKNRDKHSRDIFYEAFGFDYETLPEKFMGENAMEFMGLSDKTEQNHIRLTRWYNKKKIPQKHWPLWLIQ